MASYEVVNAIRAGMPSSPGNGTPFTLLASHDTEGGVGPAGAEGTITFLINTAAKRNASYHEIISYEPSIHRFRVYETVSKARAAHSIAPQPISPTSGLPLYVPDAHVRAYLGINVWNPNQGVYAQSIAGTVADVARYSEDRFFLECMHRRARELQALFPTMKARAEHFRFNPRTRTDWGRVLMGRLGGLVIPETLPKDTEPMITYVRALYGVRVTIQEGASIRTAPVINDETYAFAMPATGRTIQPYAIAKGDTWTADTGPMKGIASDEWYAYIVNGQHVRFIHVGNRADAETSIADALTRRLAAKDGVFEAIAAQAMKGKEV